MALKPISRIAAGVQASTTLAIDSLFKQMKAEGKDVVGFGAGEPDFPTPEHIKQAGIEAIENNQTKYTPAAGLMDLRKAACYRLKEDCGLDYEPTQIVVASGAKHSVYIALMALCNPGDEVVIAAPYWVSYSEMVKQAGAIPVIVAATEEADFKITAEHGKWFQRGGVQMTAIYHPSALLRDVEKRPETFVDLKAIQAKVREICTHTDC